MAGRRVSEVVQSNVPKLSTSQRFPRHHCVHHRLLRFQTAGGLARDIPRVLQTGRLLPPESLQGRDQPIRFGYVDIRCSPSSSWCHRLRVGSLAVLPSER